MARTKNAAYPRLPLDSIKNPVIFVVDMINGFVKEGALADPQIDACSADIAALIETLKAPVYFICDDHEEGAREFAAYPPHCIAGTAESEVCDALKPYVTNRIGKNSTNTFMAPGFQALLPEIKAFEDIIITGCCTDLCILQFVLSLQSWLNQNNLTKQRIIVPVNCVDTYDIPNVHDASAWNDMALANMAANGVTVVERIEQ